MKSDMCSIHKDKRFPVDSFNFDARRFTWCE